MTAHQWPRYSSGTSAVTCAHPGMHSGTGVMWYTDVYALLRTNRAEMFEICIYLVFIATFWLTAIQKSVSLSYVCVLQVGVYTASIKTFWCLSLLFYWIIYLSFQLKPNSHFCGSCLFLFLPTSAFQKSRVASSEPAPKSAPAINHRCNFLSTTDCRRKLWNLKIKPGPDL